MQHIAPLALRYHLPHSTFLLQSATELPNTIAHSQNAPLHGTAALWRVLNCVDQAFRFAELSLRTEVHSDMRV